MNVVLDDGVMKFVLDLPRHHFLHLDQVVLVLMNVIHLELMVQKMFHWSNKLTLQYFG
jgi:hypothetical protein